MKVQSCFGQVIGWQAVAVCTVLGLMPSGAPAQWSSDPAVNLVIGDRSNDQVQSKVRSTSDGGCYISWFDNAAGGYDVYLQRLDPRGYEFWPHNGILIANRSCSWTMDYDLEVTADDEAVLVYNDDRTGLSQVWASKVSPEGQFLWGPNGVQLSYATASEFVGPPQAAVTTDGAVVVGWTIDSHAVLQRLDADGAPQWGMPGVTEQPVGGGYTLSDVIAADNGEAIASFITGLVYYDPRRIHSQKYSVTGARLWGSNPVAVTTQNSLQFGSFPPMLPDGNGGALYRWYDTVTNNFQCRVQHLNTFGMPLFPTNGAVGATTANRLRVDPAIAYNPASNFTFMFWTEMDLSQTLFGLYGQKFNGSGVRQWTDAGKVLIAMSANQNSFNTALLCGDGAMVFCFDTADAAHVLGMRVNASGDFVWTASPRQICSRLSGKARLEADLTPSGMALLAWGDGTLGSQDLVAQNANPDGTLGLPAFITGDLNCDGLIDGLDIEAFTLALIDPAGYAELFPTCRLEQADCNGDGQVSTADVALFVNWLLAE